MRIYPTSRDERSQAALKPCYFNAPEAETARLPARTGQKQGNLNSHRLFHRGVEQLPDQLILCQCALQKNHDYTVLIRFESDVVRSTKLRAGVGVAGRRGPGRSGAPDAAGGARALRSGHRAL